MSYEIAYFAPMVGKGNKDYLAAYGSLIKGEPVQWESTPAFEAFIAELDRRWPRDNYALEGSPWASDWLAGPGYCLLSMGGEAADEAMDYMSGEQMMGDLVCYHPERSVIFYGDEPEPLF